MSFLVQMQYVLEAPERPAEEKLEELLNRAFERMLSTDLQKSPDAEEPVIHGIQDVLAALDQWDGEDADKFKLLRLYSERREVMEQLWSMQAPCAEIGRSCLELVQERYDACMEKLRNPKEVMALLEAMGLQCGENHVGRITPSVMQYARIMLQMTEDAADTMQMDVKIHIGIETFFLYGARQEDLYNDEWLLSRLKALGDPTRLKILHQLTERPCYLQEMAKTLELTPATVLHHLGVLMAEEFIEIKMTQEKKRVYYQVRKQGLQDVESGIRQLTLTRQEREEQQRQRQLQEGQQAQGGWKWNIQK
ncbi:MAG: winged helix-turn-helix domain-containing protein, partial [Acetatifactor sp.]|nr:winged helix-turn-helix domain-containing protein [Acetatifactor sp.]